jgi:hypothetical protein
MILQPFQTVNMNIRSFPLPLPLIFNSFLFASLCTSVSAYWGFNGNILSEKSVGSQPNQISKQIPINMGSSLDTPLPLPLNHPIQYLGNTAVQATAPAPLNNQLQNQVIQNFSTLELPLPELKILEACKDARTKPIFINSIINYLNESEDETAALTKLNDLFHCEGANGYLRNLATEDIIKDLDNKKISILIQALETKLKEHPQGSTQEGLTNIYVYCKENLFNLMNDLSRDQSSKFKTLTKDLCLNGSCTAQDLETLKGLTLIKTLKSSSIIVPSECAHHSMKSQVHGIIDYIKTTLRVQENPIPVHNLKDQIISILKRPKPSNLGIFSTPRISFTGFNGKEKEASLLRDSIEQLIEDCKYKMFPNQLFQVETKQNMMTMPLQQQEQSQQSQLNPTLPQLQTQSQLQTLPPLQTQVPLQAELPFAVDQQQQPAAITNPQSTGQTF